MDAGCARCGRPSTTVVIEVSVVLAYLDLCEPHLQELLHGARPVPLAEDRVPFAGVKGPVPLVPVVGTER